MPRTPVGRRLPLGARHVTAALVAGAALVVTAACSTPAGSGTPSAAPRPGGAATAAPTATASSATAARTAGMTGPRTGRTSSPPVPGGRSAPTLDTAPTTDAAAHRPVPLPPPVPAPGTRRLRGVLTRIAVEPPARRDVGGESDVRAYVRTDAGPVEIPADGVGHLATGSQVVADVAGGSLVAAGATSAQPASPAPPRRTVHDVVTVLVLPPGAKPDATTAKSLRTAVDGPVSAYWSAQTGGLVSFKVSRSYGWLRVRSSCADAWSLWAEVAARVGYVPSPRRHLMVLVPASLDGCYAGLGTIGANAEDGGYAYVRGTLPGLVAHELGHNLGLAHSNGLQCDRTADGTWSTAGWSSGCLRTAYRDWYDVMGVSWDQLGTLSTAQAYRLGVLGPDAVTTVTAPARVALTAVSLHVGLRSLRVRTPTGVTYTVEYRPALGADAWLASDWRGLRPGVLVRRDDPDGEAGQTLLLDASPSRAATFGNDWDEPLAPGASFTTGDGRVVVRVEDETATTAMVSVQVDGKLPAAGTDGVLRRLGSRQAGGDSTRVVRNAPGGPAPQSARSTERARATVTPPTR